MLSPLLALGLLLPLPQDARGKPVTAALTREEVAVDQLVAAFEGENPVARTAALNRAGRVADERVIQISAVALRDANATVRGAAIEALRFNPSPLAQRLLHTQLDQGLARDARTAAGMMLR